MRNLQDAKLQLPKKLEIMMVDDCRLVTVELSGRLVSAMEKISGQSNRSMNSIAKEALGQWVTEEQRRHELTLEALKSIDEEGTIPHEEVIAMMKQRKAERRLARP